MGLLRLIGRRHRRLGEPGPSTMELGEETPAIVNLLLHELDLGGEAFAATILDLDARGVLEVMQVGLDRHVVAVREGRDGLRAYERLVHSTVVRAAAADPAGMGAATVPAITAELRPERATSWFRFRDAVTDEAIALGLVQRHIRLRLTPEGRACGERWLGVRQFIEDHSSMHDVPAAAAAVWDRYLAHGAAMRLADEAVHGLVRELRTTMSASDVMSLARALRHAARMRDPAAAAAWADDIREEQFGPDVDEGEPLGDETGDFWALLAKAARGYFGLMLAVRARREVTLDAIDRRLKSLLAAAPPELADDVRTLEPVARVMLAAWFEPTTKEEREAAAPTVEAAASSPDVHAAATRLLSVTAERLGVPHELDAVIRALSAEDVGTAH